MSRWALLAWALWGLSFFALEFWFLFDRNPSTPPLTDVVTTAPGWLVFFVTGGVFGWLLWHWKKTYERKGR